MDHDHGAMEEAVCKMNMSLHWGACEFVLFRSWQANTVAKFVASCIGFFLMAFLYEGLKYYREVLLVESQQSRRVEKTANGTPATVKLSLKEQMLNIPHGIQTFLHFGQVFVSYILMLIIMFCNLWWILAICLGAASGYFAFGWMKKASCSVVTECCY